MNLLGMCPRCSKPIEQHPPPPPQPGEFRLCLHCACVLRHREDMSLTEATDDELVALEGEDPQTIEIIRLATQAILERGGRR